MARTAWTAQVVGTVSRARWRAARGAPLAASPPLSPVLRARLRPAETHRARRCSGLTCDRGAAAAGPGFAVSGVHPTVTTHRRAGSHSSATSMTAGASRLPAGTAVAVPLTLRFRGTHALPAALTGVRAVRAVRGAAGTEMAAAGGVGDDDDGHEAASSGDAAAGRCSACLRAPGGSIPPGPLAAGWRAAHRGWPSFRVEGGSVGPRPRAVRAGSCADQEA